MKPITMYEANDGSKWSTIEACEARDTEIAHVTAAMAPLGSRSGCTFSRFDNGQYRTGFIFHGREKVRQVKARIIELSLPRTGPIGGKSTVDELIEVDAGWFQRFIDDNGPLSRAWGRMCCFDNDGREWEQPFYVYNPDKRGDAFVVER